MAGEIPSPQESNGFSRRDFLILAGAATVVAFAGREVLGDKDTFPERRPTDVLLDPTDFTRYVDQNLDLALGRAEDSEMPLPYEVYLAVSAHESASGTSELAQNAQNYFGVIAKDGWTGEVYNKPTEEEVPADRLPALREENGEVEVLRDYGDGNIRVRYARPFRKYGSTQESFEDFAAKVYFQNQDGSYRYGDVVSYLQEGGRDPFEVTRLMADDDEPGEARYATGREWLGGVWRYIEQVQDYTGIVTGVERDTGAEIPEDVDRIDVDAINFDELNEPRDGKLVDTMKSAMESLRLSDFEAFLEGGVTEKYGDLSAILGPGNEEYIRSVYGRGEVDLRYIVWHLWANGVTDAGTPDAGPTGNAHKASLSDAVVSWRRSEEASCAYLLSDNDDGELWQLTEVPFGKTGHVRGIQDRGAETHPDANNDNAIGIEVQANSIYDVSETQFKTLLLWTTQMLFESEVIHRGMERAEVDRAIDATVVGHGKNSGLEFGYKYTRPLIAALQQFAYIAVKA